MPQKYFDKGGDALEVGGRVYGLPDIPFVIGGEILKATDHCWPGFGMVRNDTQLLERARKTKENLTIGVRYSPRIVHHATVFILYEDKNPMDDIALPQKLETVFSCNHSFSSNGDGKERVINLAEENLARLEQELKESGIPYEMDKKTNNVLALISHQRPTSSQTLQPAPLHQSS